MPLWPSFKSLSVSWHLSQLRTRWTPVANAQTVAGGGTSDFNCRNVHPAFFREGCFNDLSKVLPIFGEVSKLQVVGEGGLSSLSDVWTHPGARWQRAHRVFEPTPSGEVCSEWGVAGLVWVGFHKKGGVKICLFISLYHKCCWTVTEKLFCERKLNISQLSVF